VRASRPPLAGLDALVSRVMRELQVPGIALAVVKDGQVVLAKGYGVRRAGEAAVVGEHTLFAIASNTKAFTCAALSMLVEEGRIGWDDPVSRHLPEFQMYDPWLTRELSVRDLVTHRAGLGLGAGDLMWWPATTFSRGEIVRGIRWLKPASSLRSRYAYNNVAFVAAGELLAAVSGRSWQDFVRARILEPLAMADTTTSVPPAAGDVAAPHLVRNGLPRPVEAAAFDNAAAAAGLRSSAADMARWVRMLLECGGARPAAGVTCVLEPESIRRMWSAQTVQATPDPPPGLEPLKASFAAYGLGFGLRDYRGRKLVTHTGGLPGYLSRVALVPDERLAVVVLTNQESSAAFDAIAFHVLDAYLAPEAPSVDWLAGLRAPAEAVAGKAEQTVAKAAAARARDSQPSLPPAAYAGRYRDPWYGEATVALEDGRLVLSMSRTPGMVAPLQHWQHDTFVARWRVAYMSERQPADAYVSFALRPDAAIEKMTLEPVSPAIDFSFDYKDLVFTPVPQPAAGYDQ
jgi:CubicO group peptidase (beta-lactamase class C family)